MKPLFCIGGWQIIFKSGEIKSWDCDAANKAIAFETGISYPSTGLSLGSSALDSATDVLGRAAEDGPCT